MYDADAASTQVPTHLLRLWAKWPRDASIRSYHPVLCHLIDVASVARLMWARALTQRQRARISDELSLSELDAGTWLAFWAGLHDLGKAAPAFQTQLREEQGGAIVAQWLRDAGLPVRGATWQPHGAISALLLEDILTRIYDYSPRLAERIAALTGAHHGLFFRNDFLRDLADPQWIGDSERWGGVQDELARLLGLALHLPTERPDGDLSPAAGMLLAGFISVADWIGSNADRFTLAANIDSPPDSFDLMTYATDAMQRAAAALGDVTWDDANLTGRPQAFESLFPGKSPRPAQKQVIALADQLQGPGLVLIEVPMGEGKTEAAMYLADAWSARMGTRGAYFALPTQATSNQMFGRVQSYLQRRFHDDHLVNLHLAHGMAALSEQYDELLRRTRVANAMVYDDNPAGPADDAPDVTSTGERGSVIAASWFASSKRTLLASYGVGTIDQSLLAVLQVKHVFVRLFGLSAKTVILDEVHAYDMYMSTVMERLLGWLGALGAPVVLLSATLPAARRRTLLKAYAAGAGWPEHAIDHQRYPRVTYLLGPDLSASIPIEMDTSTRPSAPPIGLRWVNAALPQDVGEAFTLADDLREALRDGGCAAIICNTVRRAQQVFQAFQLACATWSVDERPELALFHARFAFAARQRIEQQALTDYSLTPQGECNPHRPARKILVATQVVEQSLDLDFDLMISDLAPIDLLLQRAGRLHRHRQNDPCRPPRLSRPELWIASPGADAVPGEQEGTPLDPLFDRADEFIYSPHILLRTWYALRHESELTIPDDIERLIEAVYDESPPPSDAGERLTARWLATRERDQRAATQAQSHAQAALILPPDDDALFHDAGRNLEEDAPGVHRSLQAQTRDGDPSLSVVLLDARAAAELRRSHPPSLEEARSLLGQALSLTHRGLVLLMVADPTLAPPSGWQKTPWLRHHRLITLDPHQQARFDDGRREYTLTLDDTLGLLIESRKLSRSG